MSNQSYQEVAVNLFDQACDEYAGVNANPEFYYAIAFVEFQRTVGKELEFSFDDVKNMIDTYVPPLPPTPMEWEKSPLNYHVAALPIYYKMEDGDTNFIHDEKALVRLNYQDDVPWWLANVGKDYKVVQNDEILVVVEAAIKAALPEYDSIAVRDVTSNHGREAIRHYTFEGMTRAIGKVSELALTITALNAFGSKAVEVRIGAIDYACANGMITVSPIGKKKQHTSGLDLEDLTSHIKDGVKVWQNTVSMYETWFNTPVPKDYKTWVDIYEDDGSTWTTIPEMFELLKNLVGTGTRCNLGESTIHDIVAAYDMYAIRDGYNVWALFSALTHWASASSYNGMKISHPKTEDGKATTLLDRQMYIYKVVNSNLWAKFITLCNECKPEPYSIEGRSFNDRIIAG